MIHTSHHTHYVIGTGANDPQKMDPKASRETLDHSIMYIFAVALQDGRWHHVRQLRARARRPRRHVAAVAQDRDHEDPEWTRTYHSTDPDELAFGGRVEIMFKGGTVIVDEMAVANAHRSAPAPSRGQTTSASSRR